MQAGGSYGICRVIGGCQRPPALPFGLPSASYVSPLHSHSPSPEPGRQPNVTVHRQIMNKLACLLITLNLTMLSGFAADPKTAIENIAISYLEATDAYHTLKNDYPEIADIVRSIQIDKNSVSINGDHPKAAAFRKSLAQLDLPPKSVLLQMAVTEVTKSTGKERVVSRPTLFTLERQPATVTVPSSSADKELKITITSRSVPTVAKK